MFNTQNRTSLIEVIQNGKAWRLIIFEIDPDTKQRSVRDIYESEDPEFILDHHSRHTLPDEFIKALNNKRRLKKQRLL